MTKPNQQLLNALLTYGQSLLATEANDTDDNWMSQIRAGLALRPLAMQYAIDSATDIAASEMETTPKQDRLVELMAAGVPIHQIRDAFDSMDPQ